MTTIETLLEDIKRYKLIIENSTDINDIDFYDKLIEDCQQRIDEIEYGTFGENLR